MNESIYSPKRLLLILLVLALCLTAIVGIVKKYSEHDRDYLFPPESILKKLSLEEAAESEAFGCLFPQRILSGYQLWFPYVGIYNEEMMHASFYSIKDKNDELWINIAHKRRFAESVSNYQAGEVITDSHGMSSEIYIEHGDFAVYYGFTKRNLEAIDGFWEMVYSAKCFHSGEE